MQIAVIGVGVGVGGLDTVWWRGRGHRVTLFVRQTRPGVSAARVAVLGRGSAGHALRLDLALLQRAAASAWAVAQRLGAR